MTEANLLKKASRYLATVSNKQPTLAAPPGGRHPTAYQGIPLFKTLGEFENEDLCIKHLERVRWPDGLVCIRKRCGSRRIMTFDTKGKTGKVRHLYECADCHCQYSVTTGTMFHNSHMPLNKWFLAINTVSSGNLITAKELQRKLKINYRTALQVLRRIRGSISQATD